MMQFSSLEDSELPKISLISQKKNSELTVDSEVERVIKSFHQNMKPIGLACISPILAAKVLADAKKKL